MSEWDDPEDRHRRERSRSGSFFQPDLESIHEGANAVGGGAAASGLENALAAAFQEDDSDDEEEEDNDNSDLMGAADGAAASANDSGNLGHHHHRVDLGQNIMDKEDEMEEEQEEQEEQEEEDDEPFDEEDDDEDLWEGWGEDATAGGVEEQAAPVGVAGDTGGGTFADEGKQSITGEDEGNAAAALPLPRRTRRRPPRRQEEALCPTAPFHCHHQTPVLRRL